MQILSFLISDRTHLDKETKKFTIEGIYDTIGSSDFPARHPQLVASLIIESEKEGKIDLRAWVEGENKKILSSIDKTLVMGKKQYVNIVFNDIIFPTEGVYYLKVKVGKEELKTKVYLVKSN